MATLADVFHRFGGAYCARYGEKMLPSHRRVLEDVARCRTQKMGAHLAECQNCGHRHLYYHSCQNRSCPTCQHQRTEAWVNKESERLLPVPYFHIVFTLPDALRKTTRSHQKILLSILFQAAKETLLSLLAGKKYLGGQAGFLAVLHTWSQALVYHPHLHVLVPGVGYKQDGRHTRSQKTYLISTKVLSKSFRGRFMTLAKKKLPAVTFPQSLWDKDWVIDCRPTLFHTGRVIEYLGRYVHRIAISNRRILSVGEETVTIAYQDRKTDQRKTLTLAAMDFMRRYLQHVLPKGFHKVRAYGFLSPRYRKRFEALQSDLHISAPMPMMPMSEERSPDEVPQETSWCCPKCKQQTMVISARLSASEVIALCPLAVSLRGPPARDLRHAA